MRKSGRKRTPSALLKKIATDLSSAKESKREGGQLINENEYLEECDKSTVLIGLDDLKKDEIDVNYDTDFDGNSDYEFRESTDGSSLDEDDDDDDQENYKCKVCLKSFKDNKTFKRHMRQTHKGDFNISCPYCKETFPKELHLKRHIEAKHKEYAPAATSKSFDCLICNQTFDIY